MSDRDPPPNNTPIAIRAIGSDSLPDIIILLPRWIYKNPDALDSMWEAFKTTDAYGGSPNSEELEERQ